MTITRKQVADLRRGDVVEVRWPDTTLLRGPLRADGEPGCLRCGPMTVRHGSGSPTTTHQAAELTVISRAPRPLYVNHHRTNPVPGDVVRGPQVPGVEPGTWTFTHDGWVSTRSGKWLLHPPRPARLLVDGETGQVVP